MAKHVASKRVALAVTLLFILVGVSIAVVCRGCGGRRDLYPVQGKVTATDGTALPRIQLTFESVNARHCSTAATGEDGEFRLGTVREADGAPLGAYNVTAVEALDGNLDHPCVALSTRSTPTRRHPACNSPSSQNAIVSRFNWSQPQSRRPGHPRRVVLVGEISAVGHARFARVS